MVVDDDDFVRRVVMQILQRQGVPELRSASDGVQAADVLRRYGGVDLIVCDLMMPGSDGLELMHDIAHLSPGSHLVLMSGADERVLRAARDVAAGRGLHVLGSLAKPVTPAALAALLQAPDHNGPTDSAAPPAIDDAELRQAFEAGQFRLRMQPQVQLTTGRVIGAEALVYWQSPTRGIVEPLRFLPAIERAGWTDRLADVVLHTAIASCGEWRRQGLDARVSINFEASTLSDRQLPQRILDACRAADLAPSRITVEITEGGLLDSRHDPLEVMARLRLREIGLSIDDFGTGWSTLERLQKLPFTELKLDRQFVSRALHDEQARAIVEAGIGLAKRLGLRSVAEGVASAADYALMSDLGCDFAQGYHIARGVAPEQFPHWVASRH
nr:EAL domain-containing response regulator [Solimonas marina]